VRLDEIAAGVVVPGKHDDFHHAGIPLLIILPGWWI
jgi:hypothetical protein